MPSLIVAAGLIALSSAPMRAQSRADGRVWPGEGPMTWAPRRTATEITANDVRTRLYQIADDSMQGRRIGEAGNAKTTAYIAREFQRLGLKPGGEDGSYFQLLSFGPIALERAGARLAVAGGPLALTTDWIPTLPTSTNAMAGTVDLVDVPVAFAGQWGDTTLALDPVLFRGKVLVFNALAAGEAGSGGGGRPATPLLSCADVPNKFGADAAAAVEAALRAAPLRGSAAPRPPAARTTVRDRRAQAVGAAGVLVIGLDDMNASARSAAFSSRGAMRPAALPGANATVAGATISRAAAQRLFGRPVEELSLGALGGTVSAQWHYAWQMSSIPAQNVIAILPGSDPSRAAEYVLVGAHNDHSGIATATVDHDSLRAVNTVTRRQGSNDPACRPTSEQQARIDSLLAHARRIRAPRPDSIMNGADDDGSGTALLLEIAERFAVERPARSIIFISHQGEEARLLGSRWFVDHPTVPLGSIVAAHNMDMVGKGRVEEVKFGGPNSVQTLGSRRLSREFGDLIDSVNAVRAEPMVIDRSWDVTANPMNRFCRSDQVNYVTKDVPVTYFSLGYTQDYHQLTDEAQYIDYEHSARLGRFVHDVMMAIAMRRDRPAISGADPSYPACRR